MATVINNPSGTSDNSSGMGFFIGVVLLILFLIALFYYGVPMVRQGFGGGTSINVPEKVDVNVNVQEQPQQ